MLSSFIFLPFHLPSLQVADPKCIHVRTQQQPQIYLLDRLTLQRQHQGLAIIFALPAGMYFTAWLSPSHSQFVYSLKKMKQYILYVTRTYESKTCVCHIYRKNVQSNTEHRRHVSISYQQLNLKHSLEDYLLSFRFLERSFWRLEVYEQHSSAWAHCRWKAIVFEVGSIKPWRKELILQKRVQITKFTHACR